MKKFHELFWEENQIKLSLSVYQWINFESLYQLLTWISYDSIEFIDSNPKKLRPLLALETSRNKKKKSVVSRKWIYGIFLPGILRFKLNLILNLSNSRLPSNFSYHSVDNFFKNNLLWLTSMFFYFDISTHQVNLFDCFYKLSKATRFCLLNLRLWSKITTELLDSFLPGNSSRNSHPNDNFR